MLKHTQTIRRLFTDELFECVYQFVRLALKRLSNESLQNTQMHTMLQT